MRKSTPSIANLSPEEKRALLEQLLRRRASDEAPEFSLSHGQKALWFLYQLAPESAAYNVFAAYWLRSRLDLAALGRALQDLVDRHASLRTTFTTIDGQPVQQVHPRRPVHFEVTDASAWSLDQFNNTLTYESQRPLNLEQGPILRTNLFTRKKNKHILLLTVHHIAIDGWSLAVLLQELSELYAAEKTGPSVALPPGGLSYRDFVHWQDEMLSGPEGEQLWEFWRGELAGDLPVLALPVDRPRPHVQTYHGTSHALDLCEALTGRLEELARTEHTTLYVVLLAALQLLLHRYTGQEDLRVGSPTSGRLRSGFERTVGYFVNPIVLRADLSGNPAFKVFLDQVRRKVLAALEHQAFPFPLLVERLQPVRDPSRSPLFDVMFSLQSGQRLGLENLAESFAGGEPSSTDVVSPEEEIVVPKREELLISPYPVEQRTTAFDLELQLFEAAGRITGFIRYNTDLFHESTISRMVGHFQVLLEGIVADPDQRVGEIPLLKEPERRQLLVEWNHTQTEYPRDKSLHPLIEAQVEKTPEATAIVFEGDHLTYRELNRRSNQLAHFLRRLAVGPEVLVGICMERSLEMVIGLLGILKAGGAYVPMDPEYPVERLRYMMEDARTPVLLTQRRLLERIPQQEGAAVICLDHDWKEIGRERGENPENKTDPENLAYMIYTSGSTGKPKGALNAHQGICNRLRWMQDRYGLTADDAVLQKTPFSFDVSVWEFFWPLMTGARLVVAAPGGHRDASYLVQTVNTQKITVMHFVPSMLRAFLEAPGVDRCRSLHHVICSGEALPYELQERFFSLLTAELHNLYGPTEAAVDVTHWTCQRESDRRIVPIGRPVANTQIYLLDDYLQPVPIGVPGELHIGGVQVGRGYHNRPELTAEKFIPDPFSTRPKARLYKTGDLARYLPDGAIEYLGRTDYQIKIRGFRIELGEIEAVLRAHPAVSEAVVTARGDGSRDRELVAYLVARSGEKSSLAELRTELRRQLPDYMVPSSFVLLDALPLTPNGKIDRAALPAPERDRQSDEPLVAPRNDVEKQIATIWQELLQIPQVGVNDSFFELGGNSLRAMEAVFRIHETFNTQISLSAFLEKPTIASLASLVAENKNVPLDLKDESSLQKFESEMQGMLVPKPEERYTPFPLTEVQEAYWIGRGSGYELGGVSAHIYWEAEIDGLDIVRYEQTWQRLIDRHEMLRAVILPDGRQQILEHTPPFRIKVQDLSGQSAESVHNVLTAVRDELSHQVLPSDQWPLFEIRASKLRTERYRLHFSFDALIGDGWSWQILQGEFNKLYGNPECHLSPLGVSFRDYVLAVSRFRESGVYQHSLAYWNDRLKTLPPRPELPIARSPASIEKPRFKSRQDSLEPKLWEALEQRAAKFGLTQNSLLLAAFADVLATWSKQSRFLINLTLFNRFPIHPQVDDLVGDFTSLTLLEVDLSSSEAFHELAKKLLSQLWRDLDHRFVGGVQVLRKLARNQEDRRSAVAPVVFTSALSSRKQQFYPCFLERQGEVIYSISQTPQVWLDHVVFEDNGKLVLSWFVVEDLFPPGMVDDMFQAYVSHLRRLAVDEAAWLEPKSERVKRLIPQWQLRQRKSVNATERPISDELLHRLFEMRARQNPKHTAIVCQEVRLTYSELVQLSRRIGRQLRDLGAKPNSLVAIVMEKGWEQVVAALSILQSGAAYVPIDSNLPRERLIRLLENAQVDLALTQPGLNKSLEWPNGVRRLCVEEVGLGQTDVEALEPMQNPEDLAYVIYTSGSTGLPKGVMIDHRGAVNTILDVSERFNVGPEDRVLALSSLSFDLSVYDIFGVLAAGGTIVIPEAAATRDPARWVELARQEQVTLWNSVPALMEMCVEYVAGRGEKLPQSLRVILLSGDWIPVTLPDQIKELAEGVPVISLGGATEASIWSILYPIEQVDPNWKSVPYGRPMVNQSFHVFNEALEPCPVWVPGQLYIGGIGLAKGYWRDEGKTSEKFIIHPRTGERFYCTGDLGRYLPSGDIEFLGREDFQVKIRGFRIELGEIEVAFRQHPGVRAVVVTAVGKTTADRRLVAYVVPERQGKSGPTGEGRGLDGTANPPALEAELRAFLGEKLPEYMIPPSFVLLDRLPLTPNGKVDYRSLPEPEAPDLITRGAYVPPRDETEKALAQAWQEVLHAKDVGIHDNFFEQGGDSVNAIQLITRANKMGYQFTANQVFRYPTIAELAKIVSSAPNLVVPGGMPEPVSPMTGSPKGVIPVPPDMAEFNLTQDDFEAISKALEKPTGDV